MANEILESAYKERESLLEELKKIKIYQKLMLVNGIIDAYGEKTPKQAILANTQKAKSVKDTVDDLAVSCIESNNGKATKSEISGWLEINGVEMTLPNLAAYLSASEYVKYDAEAKAWVVA